MSGFNRIETELFVHMVAIALVHTDTFFSIDFYFFLYTFNGLVPLLGTNTADSTRMLFLCSPIRTSYQSETIFIMSIHDFYGCLEPSLLFLVLVTFGFLHIHHLSVDAPKENCVVPLKSEHSFLYENVILQSFRGTNLFGFSEPILSLFILIVQAVKFGKPHHIFSRGIIQMMGLHNLQCLFIGLDGTQKRVALGIDWAKHLGGIKKSEVILVADGLKTQIFC